MNAENQYAKPIFLDNHLLVICKPPGLLSQADNTGDDDVLTVWKAYLKERFDKPGRVYLGLVHRLDRPASGVMVLARTSKAAARLSEAFRSRLVEKSYVAVVEGRPDYEGELVDFLLKRRHSVRVVPERTPGARRAISTVSLLASEGSKSVVSIRIATGRAHQIRVQLASRGTPILGDFRYGASEELDGRNLALHARRIEFEHPVRREPVRFEAPVPDVWPATYRNLLANMA